MGGTARPGAVRMPHGAPKTITAEDEAVLVCVPSRALARAITIELVRVGRRTVLHGHANAEWARDLDRALAGDDPRLVVLAGEIGSVAEVDGLVDALGKEVGPISGLVVSGRMESAERLAEHEWRAMCEWGLKLPFFIARRLGIEMMRRGRGRIVFLVADPTLRPRRSSPLADVLAACVGTMADLLRRNLQPAVRVNSILTETECFSEDMFTAFDTGAREAGAGSVADVARTVGALLSGPFWSKGLITAPAKR